MFLQRRVTLFQFKLLIFINLFRMVQLQSQMQRFVRFGENTRLSVFLYSETAGSQIGCCHKCFGEANCNSVSYNGNTKECLLSEMTYFEVYGHTKTDPDWSTYSKAGAELLVFRAVTGNGMTGSSWLQGLPADLNDLACAVPGEKLCSFYRHHLVDSWGLFPSTNLKIKFALHKDPVEQEVAYVVFDAAGSTTLEDWFTPERILSSSWPDLTPTTTFRYFAVNEASWDDHQRSFHIITFDGSCALDGGYTKTLVGLGYGGYCEYDEQSYYPQFLYSMKSTPDYFDSQDIAHADTMTISIFV